MGLHKITMRDVKGFSGNVIGIESKGKVVFPGVRKGLIEKVNLYEDRFCKKLERALARSKYKDTILKFVKEEATSPAPIVDKDSLILAMYEDPRFKSSMRTFEMFNVLPSKEDKEYVLKMLDCIRVIRKVL